MRVPRGKNVFFALILSLVAALLVSACAGADGAAGNQGPKGVQGGTGAQGLPGAEGPDGAAGPQGPQGPDGLVGEQGEKGDPAPIGFRDTNRNGPPRIAAEPFEITVGDTGIVVKGSGWSPRIGVTLEVVRLFWARAQVVRSDPEGSSTYVFGSGRANDSGAFEFVSPDDEPFPAAVEIYLDELGVDEAIFTLIARSSDNEEATFPIIVKRSPPPDSITVGLKEINASGQSGEATLTATDGQILVAVSVTTGPAGASQPIHIHAGTCEDLGGPVHTLTSVVDGVSSTTVDVTLAELLGADDFAINLHDAADASIYTACGNITIP